ncbi:MAG: L-histidine N(alpha)-methyltransferase [Alphaproteobacteria bacterium]
MRDLTLRRSQLAFHDLAPAPQDFRDAVLRGLGAPPKSIPSMFFYDARGSRLFEDICELPEYYLTRTEIGLLRRFGPEIAALMGRQARLVEFGSGSSVKVRILLDAMEDAAAYIPVDISREHLLQSASSLARDYPGIEIVPVCADYMGDLALPPLPGRRGKIVGFYPGSTIGNFSPPEAVAFLKQAARSLAPGGDLLIGVDLKKDRATLEAAYNDSRGVTAQFNLNLLRRINRELGGDFDLGRFRHRAFYDESEGRIEMHLESRAAQSARIDGAEIRFSAGETIHTENSYKYEIGEFLAIAAEAGYTPVRTWTDSRCLFSIHYLRTQRPRPAGQRSGS